MHFAKVFASEFSGSAEVVATAMAEHEATFEDMIACTREDLKAIVDKWSDTPYGDHDEVAQRCSTGVWATCLAYDLGATEVTVAGVSRVDGHVKSAAHENGIHHKADDAVFRGLLRRGLVLKSTSIALARRLGLLFESA
jgi:hypothetical protein